MTLNDRMRAVGMECFVWYFDCFRDNTITVEKLMDEKGYSKNSARTKISQGKMIFKLGLARTALCKVIESNRKKTPDWLKPDAMKLLGDYDDGQSVDICRATGEALNQKRES